MKLNRLETHDRLKHFKENQSQNIFKGADDCLKHNADSLFFQDRSHYVYLFAHPRTDDDGVTKRMLWQPRLTKPKPQENSCLCRAKSKTDIIQICWLLPPKEMWNQYQKGFVTESDLVGWSIEQYINFYDQLGRNDPDDLPEDTIRSIYREMTTTRKTQKLGFNFI